MSAYRHKSASVALIAFLAAAIGSPPAYAADKQWQAADYNYAVVNQDVRELIENFGYNLGLRVAVAPDVHGTVHGRFSAHTAGAFLDTVTSSNGLDWYFDGSVLYVTPTSDERTAAVPMHGTPFSTLRQTLADSGLTDERYGLKEQQAGDLAIVSGPPGYVSAISQAIEASTARGENTKSGPEKNLVVLRGSQSSTVMLP